MAQNDTQHDELFDRTLERIRSHCERMAGRLEPDELEQLADLLLRIFGDDAEYPCRSELEHRSLDIDSLGPYYDRLADGATRQPAPPQQSTVVLQALIARLLIGANLTSRRRREVARLHLWGFTLAEIAEHLDVPLSTVTSRWRHARRQLQRAMRDIPSVKWLECFSSDPRVTAGQAHESFREEQDRCLYQPPRHCPPGEERCRVTGICVSACAVLHGVE